MKKSNMYRYLCVLGPSARRRSSQYTKISVHVTASIPFLHFIHVPARGRSRLSAGESRRPVLKHNFLPLYLGIFFIASCAIFQPKPSTDDPLVNFYATTPRPNVKAALKLVEKARDNLKENEIHRAKNQLNTALTIDPQNAFAYYFLAFISHQEQKYETSNGLLDKAKQGFRNFPFWKAKAYELSGQNWGLLGHPKRKIWHLKEAQKYYKL